MTASRRDRHLRQPRRKGRHPMLRWRYGRSGSRLQYLSRSPLPCGLGFQHPLLGPLHSGERLPQDQ
jgi:hypothetical protein